jgi:hypothetical protein
MIADGQEKAGRFYRDASGFSNRNHVRWQTFMSTLKSFIERHWFLYENHCFECKHRDHGRARACVSATRSFSRGGEKYYAICAQHKHSRIVDAPSKYLYFMTLHTRSSRVCTRAFNSSNVIFARARFGRYKSRAIGLSN